MWINQTIRNTKTADKVVSRPRHNDLTKVKHFEGMWLEVNQGYEVLRAGSLYALS